MKAVTAPPLTVALVDDDDLSLSALERMISAERGYTVISKSSDGFSALKAVQGLTPDVVFLDIGLPDIDGVQIAELIAAQEKPPMIVFITAYDEHAVRAYELSAVDYVVKPVRSERLREALHRVRCRAGHSHARQTEPMGIDGAPGMNGDFSMVMKRGDEVHRITSETLIWVEAASQYSVLHTDFGDFVRAESLSNFAKRLEHASEFLRVHRSTLINARRVLRVTRQANYAYAIELDSGDTVNLARGRRHLLDALLANVDSVDTV